MLYGSTLQLPPSSFFPSFHISCQRAVPFFLDPHVYVVCWMYMWMLEDDIVCLWSSNFFFFVVVCFIESESCQFFRVHLPRTTRDHLSLASWVMGVQVASKPVWHFYEFWGFNLQSSCTESTLATDLNLFSYSTAYFFSFSFFFLRQDSLYSSQDDFNSVARCNLDLNLHDLSIGV